MRSFQPWAITIAFNSGELGWLLWVDESGSTSRNSPRLRARVNEHFTVSRCLPRDWLLLSSLLAFHSLCNRQAASASTSPSISNSDPRITTLLRSEEHTSELQS